MNKFNVGEIFRCPEKYGDDNYFIVEKVDNNRKYYDIRWYNPGISGSINFKDVKSEDGKTTIFAKHEVYKLSDYDALVFKLKYSHEN